MNRRVESHFAHTLEELKQAITVQTNGTIQVHYCYQNLLQACQHVVKQLLTIMVTKQNIKSVKKELC
jgi:hypothetical protein